MKIHSTRKLTIDNNNKLIQIYRYSSSYRTPLNSPQEAMQLVRYRAISQEATMNIHREDTIYHLSKYREDENENGPDRKREIREWID